jgi:hypothetical protein
MTPRAHCLSSNLSKTGLTVKANVTMTIVLATPKVIVVIKLLRLLSLPVLWSLVHRCSIFWSETVSALKVNVILTFVPLILNSMWLWTCYSNIKRDQPFGQYQAPVKFEGQGLNNCRVIRRKLFWHKVNVNLTTESLIPKMIESSYWAETNMTYKVNVTLTFQPWPQIK